MATVAITRQVLINDDLDAFTRIPAMYGNSIAQLESDVVWGIITSNPAMADGTALFHANHKNLAGTGAALAVDAVGAAVIPQAILRCLLGHLFVILPQADLLIVISVGGIAHCGSIKVPVVS